MTTRICVFEGDDAAPEAVTATCGLLTSLDVDLEFTTPHVGGHADALRAGTLPEELRSAIESADTVLFGAGSDLHATILRYLRWEYGGGTYANLRPVCHFEGATSPLSDPEGIDYLVVRENLEGLYVRAEGDLPEAAGTLDATSVGGTSLKDLGPGQYALRVTSEAHTRRFARFACETAADRVEETQPIRLTCATKSNVLPGTDGLFERTVERTAAEYDQLTYEHLHVDDAAQRLVTDPRRFDVIVTPNFAGDVLSDVGAGTTGGLGVAPSGCYGDDVAYFEPVHGSAPDIAGEGSINPTATLLSAAMLLEYVGAPAEATRLVRAIEATYRDGASLTPDQGGTATTEAFTAAVTDHL
ncbi:isocitrate/isopropylmalate family dehydrogenase [Halomarina halobia]|uniref:Isocitrate/isopropylmalate family dehydrogenase n=1 Tax=Halomarina halobia TaxID=3033386 RepID=A0ABD6AEZ0_9EURY|nr:isocitrate/isopropylmalate family dehydrogenase [Halomarina sp. PSR21]